MKLYNIIDEKGRFCGYKAIANEYGKQVDTHGCSYLFARNELKSIGMKMGLELKLEKEE